MYLARKSVEGKTHFFIRETYREGPLLRHRELFCLGPDPSRFIVYPGGNAYYVSEEVTDHLSIHDDPSLDDTLDDIFWPFVRADVRDKVAPFRSRSTVRASRRFGGKVERNGIAEELHAFDKDRICFLKCGHVDQRTIARFPAGAFGRIHEKSRDEIEQHFLVEEYCLRPNELKGYVCAIFGLHRFFSESFAATAPQWLDQERLDGLFLEEICRLQKDAAFWGGERTGGRLHEYLQRYVIMFFDYDYHRPRPMEDYVRDFINRHRKRDFSRRSAPVTVEQVSAVFGVDGKKLKIMTTRSIRRMYRKLAKKFHPDKGGPQEKFVQLTEAYHALLKRRGEKP